MLRAVFINEAQANSVIVAHESQHRLAANTEPDLAEIGDIVVAKLSPFISIVFASLKAYICSDLGVF